MDARHVGFGLGGRSASFRSTERSRRHRPAVAVETLEGRALLSGVVANVTTLPATVQAGPMVAASDNSLWFVQNNGTPTASLARLDVSGTKTDVALPSSMEPATIAGIAADKSGDVWFSVQTPNQGVGYSYRGKVGEVTPNGTVKEFLFPSYDDTPGAATMGPDGNLWVAFTNVQNGAGVARFVPNGNVTEVMVKGATSVSSLTSGPDGNLWFVDSNKIGKVSTAGNVTEYNVGSSGVDLSNAHLTAGGDGNLWFLNSGSLNSITPSGNVRSFTTPAGQLTSLSQSPDGNLWYTLQPAANGPLSNKPGPVVARLSPQGVTTILPDRAGDATANVTSISPAPDGSIWFNEGNRTIGRISPAVTLPNVSQSQIPLILTSGNPNFSGTILAFTSNLLGTTASSFQVGIDWGDGHISAGSVIANASGGFDVVGSNTFNAPPGAIETATVVINGPDSTQSVLKNSVFITQGPGGGPWTTFPSGSTGTPAPVTPAPKPTPTPVTTPTPVVATPAPVTTPTPVATPTPTPVVTTPTPTLSAPTPASSPTSTTATPSPTSSTATTTTTSTPAANSTPANSTTTTSSTSPGVTVNVSVNPTLNSNTGTTATPVAATAGPHWVRGPRGRWVLVHGGATVQNVGASHPKAHGVHKVARHHR